MQEIKRNPDWLTFSDIRERLGYKSHQGVHAAVFTSRIFDFADITHVMIGDQPLYLVRRSAVEAYERLRQEMASQTEQNRAAAEAAQHRQTATVAARQQMRALFRQCAIAGRQTRCNYVARVLGRPVDDWYGLTLEEATAVSQRLTSTLRRANRAKAVA